MEINAGVNYPLKACLVNLEAAHDIDMDCDHIKYCVSWFTIRVASAGVRLAVQSWNEHPIPGTLFIERYSDAYCSCAFIIICRS